MSGHTESDSVGWPPNHALQRTWHSALVCNRRILCAGVLSLGRWGSKMGKTAGVFLMAVAIATLSGCRILFDVVTDISGESCAWGGWERNGLYSTTRPLMLSEVPGGGRWRIKESERYEPPDDPNHGTTMISAEELALHPNCCPGIEFLPSGTVFRAESVRWRESFESSWLDVYGRIVEGPFSGRRVELSSVSVPFPSLEECKWGPMRPNPEYVRRR